MELSQRTLFAGGALLIAIATAHAAVAQKSGGILNISHFDSPASVSLHEEATAAALRPMMGVFNNLVVYRQDVPQASLQSIVPDLATGWTWSEDGTELTFPLRQGVKWHDGKPFTAKDVKCTWDLLQGKASEKLRVNPREGDLHRRDAGYSRYDAMVPDAGAARFHCWAQCHRDRRRRSGPAILRELRVRRGA